MDESHKIIRNVTLAGMVCNVLLTVGKFLAGIFCHSQTLIADAIHSLSDLTTDLAVIIGVRYWSAPPDASHPYGHGRIETIVTVIIGAVLAAAGFSIAWEALAGLQENTESHAPGMPAFIIALCSIVLKEWLFRWTVRKADSVQSSALKANAWHHRSDAISSIPAAIAIGISFFLPDWAFVDKIGAIIVSTFILHSAWTIMREPLMQLADAGAPHKINEIKALALAVPGACSVHCIRARHSGSWLLVDMHLMVQPTLTVREGHHIAETVHDELIRSRLHIRDVIVHIEPADDDSSDEEMYAGLQQH